jgi:hypothetical protein
MGRGHCVSFAGAVEIVGMLVMAEQHRIDLSDLVCRARRPARPDVAWPRFVAAAAGDSGGRSAGGGVIVSRMTK